MLEYAREAVTLMRGKTRADLDSDRAWGLATLRCLEIVGEAASHVPEDVRQCNPSIPWAAIIGTRNRLVHGYDLVDYDIIWSTVTEPALIADWRRSSQQKIASERFHVSRVDPEDQELTPKTFQELTPKTPKTAPKTSKIDYRLKQQATRDVT